MPWKIYRRGEIWHYSITAAGRRLRRSCGTADKGLAQRIAAEAEAREWRRHLDGPEVTMAQAALAYRQAEKPDRFLARIEDHWRDTKVRDIKPGAIRQSALTLYPNATGATRNRQVIVPTQAIINHAASLGWCAPIKVERFKVEAKSKSPADWQWVRAFMAEASPHLGALCVFMFGTGARIGEAVALTWGDVDLAQRTALIRQTKIGAERRAHLPGPVLAALANIPGERGAAERVFQYLDAQNVKQVWEAAIKRAGITRLTPHSCRHGFATTLLRKGHDVKTVARMGGWKDAATVLKFYAHAVEDTTVTEAIFDTNPAQLAGRNSLTDGKQRMIVS